MSASARAAGGGAAATPGQQVSRLPLVDLHDHLDGGLRPQTVIDLARECGYRGLPTTDADALGAWFTAAADSGSLERFLETFAHTVAVLQTPAALTRVAAEAVADLARDGVAWAEIRMAPELCANESMSMVQATRAMLAGLREGERAARADGLHIESGLILCAMRQADRAVAVAQVLRETLDDGVIGFDIAGPEAGFPADRLADAFAVVRATPARITVHAGEAAGVESIKAALAVGAERLGHGVRIADDITVTDEGEAVLGPVASYVRDRGIALELCPSSNLQTGAVASLPEHPIGLLDDLGFVVTVNPDNRLMCGVRVSQEAAGADAMLAPDPGRRARWARNAVLASFAPYEVKQRLLRALDAVDAVDAPDAMAVPGAPDALDGPERGR